MREIVKKTNDQKRPKKHPNKQNRYSEINKWPETNRKKPNKHNRDSEINKWQETNRKNLTNRIEIVKKTNDKKRPEIDLTNRIC